MNIGYEGLMSIIYVNIIRDVLVWIEMLLVVSGYDVSEWVIGWLIGFVLDIII